MVLTFLFAKYVASAFTSRTIFFFKISHNFLQGDHFYSFPKTFMFVHYCGAIHMLEETTNILLLKCAFFKKSGPSRLSRLTG